jgi:hypothetical protein
MTCTVGALAERGYQWQPLVVERLMEGRIVRPKGDKNVGILEDGAKRLTSAELI